MTETIETLRPQIDWVTEALIPADPDGVLPSGLAAGVPETLLPRALKARDDLIPPFAEALARLPKTAPADPLQALRDLGPAAFDLVSHVIAGAYFLSDDVLGRLKYPGQEALPYDPDYDEIMEVCQRVIDRGPVYIDPGKA